MKRSLCLTMLFCWACLPACGLDVQELTVSEEGAVGLAGVHVPGLGSFNTSLEKALSGAGINAADVDSLHILSASLEMTTQGGLTDDLSFFQKFDLLVSAQGLPETLLASVPGLPAAQTSFTLKTDTDLDLKPYLAAGNMQIVVEAEMNPIPPDQVGIKLTFRIRVDVNVI